MINNAVRQDMKGITEKVIVAGFGGQGVLSIGQFISYSAMYEGLETTWLPSYGPEMRGGTASCSVVVSEEQVASPVISAPDTLIVMNKPSFDKYVNGVRPGGRIIVNSSLISDKVERGDVDVFYIDANALAVKAGNTKTANIVILAAYVKITGIFAPETVKATISKIFEKKPKTIPANMAAFDLGYNIV